MIQFDLIFWNWEESHQVVVCNHVFVLLKMTQQVSEQVDPVKMVSSEFHSWSRYLSRLNESYGRVGMIQLLAFEGSNKDWQCDYP